ncbi:type II toxin-antitoxin system Phd/YefM family antitoxin [Sphingomonas azotifigens]|uniref:type II toxin-antitoxin system Phd/YefM family antitoxin n=1 Tax=Sphingomonas azotifigens TaxID=330920 RepID=UPI0009FDD652|nr:type II toxin-antitoxin system Phd/YefM family antitoxin [Sphingomonas azotifigens]
MRTISATELDGTLDEVLAAVAETREAVRINRPDGEGVVMIAATQWAMMQAVLDGQSPLPKT